MFELKKEYLLWILRYSSLLHDIGKFRQRIGMTKVEHQNAGFDLIEKLTFPFDEGFKGEVARFVGSHHPDRKTLIKPPSEGELKRLHDVLVEADGISSAEREASGAEGEDIIFKLPLRSIFYEIKLNPNTEAKEYYYNLSAFEEFDEETTLPRLEKDKLPETLVPNYRELWVRFEKETEKIAKIREVKSHFSTLYNLLMKYTCFIPSAIYRSEPTISLFDHLSTTCAIAESIYRSEDNETLMLIGGDIGNIQSFIYTVTSENASKVLRGRSFFVQLINILVAKYIMDRLDLPDPCLIFCGGGNFIILSPWNKEIEERLKTTIKEVNSWLLEELNGEVSVAIGYTKVKKSELRENYGKCLDKLQFEVKKVKLKPLIEADYMKVFEGSFRETGEKKRCGICRKIFLDESEVEKINDTEVCSLCKKFERIGDELVKAEHLLITYYKEELSYEPPKTPFLSFRKINVKVGIFRDVKNLSKYLQVLAGVKQLQIVRLNNGNFLEKELVEEISKRSLPVTFSFIPIANHVPIGEDGKVLSFDDIAKEGKGANYLAVLMMDVDNLGRILVEGFPKEKRTIARYATLTRLLSWFFEGYINQFIRGGLQVTSNDKIEDAKKKLYIVYSGGDDLLVIGHWDAVCEFAWRFEEKFKKLVCENSDVTISGGLALAEPKYPIYRLWHVAKDYISSAKNEKNRIAIFSKEKDYTVTWQVLKKLREFKCELVEMINRDKVARGFLFSLRRLYHVYNNQGVRKAVTLLKYIVGRKVSEDLSAKGEFYKIEKKINEYLPFINIPAIWGELETRREKYGKAK